MSHIRSPHVLPFALLATLVAACSSSSSPIETPDTGTKPDTGTTSHMDAGTDDTGTHTDAVTKHDGMIVTQKDTGVTADVVVPPADAGLGPQVPATATAIATGALIDVLGITTDGYLAYFDTTGAIKAADATGTIVTVAPAADAGVNGYVGAVTGEYVWVLTDYTVTTGASATEIDGTLSIWSHTLGTLTQIATHSNGIVNIAANGSAIVYTDSSDSTGKFGNIGVVGASGTGGADMVTNVGIDSSSTSCPPLASIDTTYIVTSACTRVDGGTYEAAVITSYNTTTKTSTVLLNGAIPTNVSSAPVAVDFATDTSGDNVLVVNKTGPTLAVQGIASAMGTETTVLDPYSAPAMGQSFFYLSQASTFALFTTPSGHLDLATFATPTSAPVIGTPYTDTVLSVTAISPDDKWDLDQSTAIDQGTQYPTSLAIRNIQTGVATQAVTAGQGDVGTFANTFTTDVSYVFFTNGLAEVTTSLGAATVGTLVSAPVGTGVNNILEAASSKVWNATSVPTVAKAILYNKNWAPITLDSMLPNNDSTADVYIVSADQNTTTTPPTLLVTGADAPNDFYITPDGKNMFFTFSQVTTADGGASGPGLALFSTDGLYVMPIPAP